MDVLSDLLHRAGARNATVRQLIQRPPWSLAFTHAAPLAVVATLGGHAWIRLDDDGAASVRLTDGDIALITGPQRYTIADDPATPPQVEIRGQQKHVIGKDGNSTQAHRQIAPRAFGDRQLGATTLLRGAYQLHGDAAGRLLDLLPPLAVVRAGPRTEAALNLLTTETARDEPGQDAILHRLLDLVLVL